MLSAPIVDGPFQSIGDVKRAHDGHFFDEDTMRFFSSRIVDDYPRHGRFFRTTEQDRHGSAWGGKRLCTIRFSSNDGSIDSLGEHGEFATAAGAKRLLDKLETATLVHAEPDQHGRRFWHVILTTSDGIEIRAGSAYFDLPGALQVFDELTGQTKRQPLHDAINALSAARYPLTRVSDDARKKVERQIAALNRRRDALVAQLIRKAGLTEEVANDAR